MTKPAADPRLSATILLLRDQDIAGSDNQLQVLMVARHYQIDFASGALVFPGGKVVEDDHSPVWMDDELCMGGFTGAELAARIAAIRETFEEVGILLARHHSAPATSDPLVGQKFADAIADLRGPVDRGEIKFSDVMREHKLVLAVDRLLPFAHWITPTMMPKRFDTHFFLAVTPSGQMAQHDGRETTDTIWIAPQTAVEMGESGDATIIFPTRMNLCQLAMAKSCEEAWSLFSDAEITTVLPQIDKMPDGRPCLRIPEVKGYPVTLEPLESIKV